MVRVEYHNLMTGVPFVKYRLHNADIEITYTNIGDVYDLTNEEATHILTEYPDNFRRTVAVELSPVKKYTNTHTLTAGVPETVTHNLATDAINVSVYNSVTGEEEFVEEDRNTGDSNSVILTSSDTITVVVVVIG